MNNSEGKIPEEETPDIETRDSAWTAMLDVINSPLSTNDPAIAFALVAIAFEIRELVELNQKIYGRFNG